MLGQQRCGSPGQRGGWQECRGWRSKSSCRGEVSSSPQRRAARHILMHCWAPKHRPGIQFWTSSFPVLEMMMCQPVWVCVCARVCVYSESGGCNEDVVVLFLNSLSLSLFLSLALAISLYLSLPLSIFLTHVQDASSNDVDRQ